MARLDKNTPVGVGEMRKFCRPSVVQVRAERRCGSAGVAPISGYFIIDSFLQVMRLYSTRYIVHSLRPLRIPGVTGYFIFQSFLWHASRRRCLARCSLFPRLFPGPLNLIPCLLLNSIPAVTLHTSNAVHRRTSTHSAANWSQLPRTHPRESRSRHSRGGGPGMCLGGASDCSKAEAQSHSFRVNLRPK
jgi:hypothetical protein